MVTEDKVKLVLKGILLYTTCIVCLLSMGGIDDIYDKGYLPIDIAICAGLIYTCYKVINKEEIGTLLLDKYLGEGPEENNEW